MECSLSKKQLQSETQDETSLKELEKMNDNSSTKCSAMPEVCESESVNSDNDDSWSTIQQIHEIIIEDNDDQQNEIAEILNLKVSAGSLEAITSRTPIGHLPGLVFPVMKRVIELNLLFIWYGSDATSFTGYLRAGENFPKGFKFSVLPNLRKVVIDLETEGKSPQYYSRFDCWKNNLKYCGIARRVKSIQYNDDCGFSKQRLKTTFPNAKWKKTSDLNTTYTSLEEDSEEESEEEESEDEQD